MKAGNILKAAELANLLRHADELLQAVRGYHGEGEVSWTRSSGSVYRLKLSKDVVIGLVQGEAGRITDQLRALGVTFPGDAKLMPPAPPGPMGLGQ